MSMPVLRIVFQHLFCLDFGGDLFARFQYVKDGTLNYTEQNNI